MKKIEPVAWALRENGGICFDKSIADKWDDKPDPLYTREALEAVAEAVKAQCMEEAAAWSMSFVQVDNAPHGIGDELGKYVDPAAIINQLTGE